MQIVKLFYLTFLTFCLLVINSAAIADEIVHYDNKGRALNQYQCDKVSDHKSARQDTLVCTRNKAVRVNDLTMQVIRNANDERRCKQNRNCVVIDNQRDPHWVPIALTGIPDAVFGRNASGGSCAVIRESKPAGITWDSAQWRLCTNNPSIDIAFTYALGYSNENVDRRFKTKKARRVCFGDVLRNYKYREFWKDNCIFIRPVEKPVAGFR